MQKTEPLEVAVLASISSLAATSPPGTFLTWGVFGIQLGNLLVIVAMFALFGAALIAPFPRGKQKR